MKNRYLLVVMLCITNFAFAQLTVTTNPTSAAANVCAGNSVSITATATPVGYTVAAIANNPYDPTMFATTELFDQANGIAEPLSFGTLDDGRWDNISLPFTFRFYGNTFNSIHISTNGWVGLGSTNSTATGLNTTLPNAGAPNNVIHAITTDLTFAGVSNAAVLQYFEAGSAPNRRFVVDFSNLKFFSGSATANVQVILYETTNVIEIHTTNCTNTAANKAQGIENSTGTIAAVATGRNNTASWTGMPNAYRFTPDNITYSWSPATGLNTTTGATVIATPANTTTYTVTALNTVNSATGNTTVTVTVNPASYTLAAVAGGPQICQNISVSPSGTNYRDGNCNLITNILPTGGATAVSNSINTCIKIDTGATKRGTSALYLARRYDIEPIINPYPATSTADVTLYYLQSEFNNYNLKAVDSGYKLLPAGPADATGISNLVLRQFHGTGTNPNNYTGPSQDFTTAISGFTVTWNSTRSWWEVKIPVTSFSGFYITSAPLGPLAVSLDYFKGVQADTKNLLSWKVNCTSEKVIFEIQRSADGQHFTTLSTVTADQLRCSQPFDNADEHPLSGLNYYRIKIIDPNDKFYYSNTIVLMVKTKGFEMVNISPNPVAQEKAILKINAGEKTQVTISISDFSGRIIGNQTAQLLPGINQVVLNTRFLARGAYQVTTYAPGATPQSTKLIKQ
ncbi:T9SS type A sorting domain-containing protein [Ferruginibacter sp. SUN106]|uniref:T9SS type A sorting domain-containing protein n=1 Tax=Ferruginibacter sp. SUN106 TaxID=2978348 RepID=UPI003D364EBE